MRVGGEGGCGGKGCQQDPAHGPPQPRNRSGNCSWCARAALTTPEDPLATHQEPQVSLSYFILSDAPEAMLCPRPSRLASEHRIRICYPADTPSTVRVPCTLCTGQHRASPASGTPTGQACSQLPCAQQTPSGALKTTPRHRSVRHMHSASTLCEFSGPDRPNLNVMPVREGPKVGKCSTGRPVPRVLVLQTDTGHRIDYVRTTPGPAHVDVRDIEPVERVRRLSIADAHQMWKALAPQSLGCLALSRLPPGHDVRLHDVAMQKSSVGYQGRAARDRTCRTHAFPG